jgi:protein TonB
LEQPEILYGEEPLDYPLDLFDQGQEGEALVRVLVDERGTVDSVEVAESSGNAELDHAALESLRTTRFTPARRGDDRVRAWVVIPVRFSTRPRPDVGPGT